jgi:hypothetical protein
MLFISVEGCAVVKSPGRLRRVNIAVGALSSDTVNGLGWAAQVVFLDAFGQPLFTGTIDAGAPAVRVHAFPSQKDVEEGRRRTGLRLLTRPPEDRPVA